ncbi:MAG: pantoate--beta-alanine ligase [Acidobacteria bacterium]|nr:pantoate--beta-alanine ligase [Acidobacteriota bacterium]
MRVISAITEMQTFAGEIRATGRSLGLVPTMGALHDGHFRLIRQAKAQCDAVVVSIFVNPTQFGAGEDYGQYPRNLSKDLEFLRAYKVDASFTPSVAEMYPELFDTSVAPGDLASSLEGVCRPGHLRGVVTVVTKLFNIVRPDVAYFGQKDFQQGLLIRRLVQDLNLAVRVVICPTVRDAEGLAKSSRHAYMSAEDRRAALVLHRCLRRAEALVFGGESRSSKLREAMEEVLASEPRARVDYAAIVDPVRLQPVDRVTSGCVALVAARVGAARLIDNLIFGPPGTNPEMLLQTVLTAGPVTDSGARIPGLETETLRLKIEGCRECAAISSIRLPPREFLTQYVKRDYPDLNVVRVAVIGRDAPPGLEHFFYRNPERSNRFAALVYDLVGVEDFAAFKRRFVMTHAIRCHATETHVPDKALLYCAQHLIAELNLFPNIEAIVILGDDAYVQFQTLLLGRGPGGFKPLHELLPEKGWAREDVRVPPLGDRVMRAFYCYHPTMDYRRSPSIGAMLEG